MIDEGYRNNLKNREFGKEGPQNFQFGASDHCQRLAPSENGNYEGNPTSPKTDSSCCFGIKAPKALKELQEWFGAVITQPIDQDSRINPIAPSGNSIEEEAKRYISPSITLTSKERIELYNQQYWWRLLNIMQQNFPLLTRLFGCQDFNHTIAMPYLERYPSSHWSLNTLGDTLPKWISENYHEEDKSLVLESALIDASFNAGFCAKELKQIVEGARVLLQPHVTLLELSYDIIPFRTKVLDKDPEYFADHNFPHLKKQKTFGAIYRGKDLQISWKELSQAEYFALTQFSQEKSVEEFCDWLSTQDRDFVRESEKNLILWFQEWTALGFLGMA